MLENVQDLILNVLELCCQSCGVPLLQGIYYWLWNFAETSESRFIMTFFMHILIDASEEILHILVELHYVY